MRTSILSRSVIAVASLAVGSAALAAVPATAATPSGVTRDAVLKVAAAARATPDAEYDEYDAATRRALRGIVNRTCDTDPDAGEVIVYAGARPTEAGRHADGALIFGVIASPDDETYRFCLVGAVAASAPGFALTGSSTLHVTLYDSSEDPASPSPTTVTTPLSGDVTVSRVKLGGSTYFSDSSFSAAGSSTKSTKTTTSKKVSTPKTKAQKKAAKKKYDKRLKAAKKAYDKALKKAGSSTSKKTAATKAYNKKKASAKASYKKAIASYKIVKKTTTKVDSRPFSISASSDVAL